jgi:sarcosine oxidase subunit alpha
MTVAGAAAGVLSAGRCLADGARRPRCGAEATGQHRAFEPPRGRRRGERAHARCGTSAAPRQSLRRFQHDVTADDIALAHREGFGAVEHLKRYTTLGMATDQGKTSNVPRSASSRRWRPAITEVGTTTFRPPYTPVAIGA